MDGQRQMICVGIPNLFYIFFFSGELFKKRLKPPPAQDSRTATLQIASSNRSYCRGRLYAKFLRNRPFLSRGTFSQDKGCIPKKKTTCNACKIGRHTINGRLSIRADQTRNCDTDTQKAVIWKRGLTFDRGNQIHHTIHICGVL